MILSAVFYPGGHGPLFEFTNDEHSIQLIKNFWSERRSPLLQSVMLPRYCSMWMMKMGFHLWKVKIFGFANTEEEAVQLTDISSIFAGR